MGVARPVSLVVLVCAAAAVGLAACSADGGSAEVATVGSGTHESASSEDGGETETPEARTWADYLDSLARSLQIEEPPEVEVVRLVAPEGRHDVLVACVGEEGFPVDENGARMFPFEQLEVFNLAMYTCEARYPMDEKFLQPLTEDQVRRIHAYLVDSAVPCLAELGYEVPPPPSVETFVRTFDVPGEGYVLSGELLDLGLGQSLMENVLAECPEFPPSGELYD